MMAVRVRPEEVGQPASKILMFVTMIVAVLVIVVMRMGMVMPVIVAGEMIFIARWMAATGVIVILFAMRFGLFLHGRSTASLVASV